MANFGMLHGVHCKSKAQMEAQCKSWCAKMCLRDDVPEKRHNAIIKSAKFMSLAQAYAVTKTIFFLFLQFTRIYLYVFCVYFMAFLWVLCQWSGVKVRRVSKLRFVRVDRRMYKTFGVSACHQLSIELMFMCTVLFSLLMLLHRTTTATVLIETWNMLIKFNLRFDSFSTVFEYGK